MLYIGLQIYFLWLFKKITITNFKTIRSEWRESHIFPIFVARSTIFLYGMGAIWEVACSGLCLWQPYVMEENQWVRAVRDAVRGAKWKIQKTSHQFHSHCLSREILGKAPRRAGVHICDHRMEFSLSSLTQNNLQKQLSGQGFARANSSRRNTAHLDMKVW